MAKWIQLPNPPIYWQPDQQRFLEARRLRQCVKCKHKYSVAPPEIIDCPACSGKGLRSFDRLAVIAGRRYGKSRFGSIAGVEEATIPNTIGWCCAPTNPKLHRYVIPAFQQLIPEDWIDSWNAEYLDLRLKNGSLIHFQTLEHPDQGRGQGLDWLWIDEVCELSLEHWNVIRPSLGDKLGVAFFTTSPRSFDWVHDNFYKKAEEEFPGYWALKAHTSDNPKFQTAEGQAFLASEKESMSDEMYRQEYEADFVTFTGAIYGDLIKSQILRTPDQIKEVIPEWPEVAEWRQRLVGIDTGADHPFGAVKLVSTESGLVVAGEYLERDKSFIQHAQNLKMLAGPFQTKWAINKNERQALIEFVQHGITPQRAENDQVAGIERVKSWLIQKKLWFIEPNVPRTIRQMLSYRWDKNVSDDGQTRKEKVYKKDDELPDCFIAGTLIHTDRGVLPIEHLITGDRVLTRKGYQPITCTGSRIVPTHTLRLSDGSLLTGTASHPIWTSDGFVPLTSLRYGDMIWPCTQTITDLGLDPSGEKLTDPFQSIITSIIVMVTRPTTLWKTWSAFQRRITSGITCSLDHWFNRCVEHVEQRFPVRIPSWASVLQLAKLNGDAILASTTNLESANNVEWNSSAIAIRTSDFVPSLVDVDDTLGKWLSKSVWVAARLFRPIPRGSVPTVVGSEPTGKLERVYNLSVDTCQEYFANSILVHNCIRYALMTWPRLPIGPPEPVEKKRNLSHLSPSARHSVERMRRIEDNLTKTEPDKNDQVGDFWL